MKTFQLVRTLPPIALLLFFSACDKPAPRAAVEPAVTSSSASNFGEAERIAAEQRIRELELQEQALRQEIEAERIAALKAGLAAEQDKLAAEQKEWLAKKDAPVGTISNSSKNSPKAKVVAESPEPTATTAKFSTSIATDDYQLFFDELKPHGQWFQSPDYGYIWQPNASQQQNWRPYTQGSWVNSDQGWTWVSDEPYGWACYHYGRWTQIRNRGWVWIPGSVWAPAWVAWRSSSDNVGWCPLPPETNHCEHSLGTTVDQDYGLSADWYTYVPANRFADPVADCYVTSSGSGNSLFGTTVSITNIFFKANKVHCHGPEEDWVREKCHKPVRKVALRCEEHRTKGQTDWYRPQLKNDTLCLFTPNVRAQWNADLKPTFPCGLLKDAKDSRQHDAVRPELRHQHETACRLEQERSHVAVQNGLGKKVIERQSLLERIHREQANIVPTIPNLVVNGGLDKGHDHNGERNDNKGRPTVVVAPGVMPPHPGLGKLREGQGNPHPTTGPDPLPSHGFGNDIAGGKATTEIAPKPKIVADTATPGDAVADPGRKTDPRFPKDRTELADRKGLTDRTDRTDPSLPPRPAVVEENKRPEVGKPALDPVMPPPAVAVTETRRPGGKQKPEPTEPNLPNSTAKPPRPTVVEENKRPEVGKPALDPVMPPPAVAVTETRRPSGNEKPEPTEPTLPNSTAKPPRPMVVEENKRPEVGKPTPVQVLPTPTSTSTATATATEPHRETTASNTDSEKRREVMTKAQDAIANQQQALMEARRQAQAEADAAQQAKRLESMKKTQEDVAGQQTEARRQAQADADAAQQAKHLESMKKTQEDVASQQMEARRQAQAEAADAAQQAKRLESMKKTQEDAATQLMEARRQAQAEADAAQQAKRLESMKKTQEDVASQQAEARRQAQAQAQAQETMQQREAVARKAKEDQDRQQEEAKATQRAVMERQREDAQKQAVMERQREDAQKQAVMERQREDAQKQAVMERQREDAQKQAVMERQREDAQKQAVMERQREEAQKQAQMERQREEAQKQAQMERQREEAQKQAQMERQREEAQKQAQMERQREEAQKQAQMERQREEAQQRAKAAQDAAQGGRK